MKRIIETPTSQPMKPPAPMGMTGGILVIALLLAIFLLRKKRK